MRPNRQDLLNQLRENTIIEIVQATAKSEAGARIAFKGGTALKLFYNLPRFSEDIDYDWVQCRSKDNLIKQLSGVCRKKRWEITDEAVKHHTILLELRFKGIDRNFRVKIEVSTRKKSVETTHMNLRGVPIQVLEPTLLMTEKLFAFLDRHAGRDTFDAWYIISHSNPLNNKMIRDAFGNYHIFYQTILDKIDTISPNKLLRDTGKLLDADLRNWIKTTFLDDFKALLNRKIMTAKGIHSV